MERELGLLRSEKRKERNDNLTRTTIKNSCASNEKVPKKHTQKACSQKKLGCRDHAHKPRVRNPLFASRAVHLNCAPGQAFFC